MQNYLLLLTELVIYVCVIFKVIALLSIKLKMRTDKRIFVITGGQCLFFAHLIVVKTKKESYTFRKKISELAKELPSFFAQTSRSYIVNLNYVKSVHSDSVKMCDGTLIQMSRLFKKSFIDKFMKKW